MRRDLSIRADDRYRIIPRYSKMGGEEEAAARIQAAQRGRLARLSVDRRRRSLVRRETTARWEREQAVIKIQVETSSSTRTQRACAGPVTDTAATATCVCTRVYVYTRS